ncbi:hypothetical protein HYC85_031325 [Camellia sinensis]|uniref:Guanylate-binding protein N-terminal domain-containing protein n=1 Tax=Camellia sinensis TaxID=4442 RepID=A0A7J7FQG8_CAMSI|nr:hypothetical protein HYC85_031325 [Camellia sinensis]
MASKFLTSFPLSPHVFKTSRFRCFLLSICKITPSAAITMKIACWVVVFSIFLCLFAYGSFSIDVFRKGFPIVEPDPDHTKLRIAREGLEAIERINNPIAAVFVIGPYLCVKSFLLDQLLFLSCYEGFGVGHMRDTKTKLDADHDEVDLSNHPFTDITYRYFVIFYRDMSMGNPARIGY